MHTDYKTARAEGVYWLTIAFKLKIGGIRNVWPDYHTRARQ